MTDRVRATVELPYGSGTEVADLPDGWALDLVAPAGPLDLPDPGRALLEVLDNPLHSPPLSARLPASGRVLLLVSDRTRKDGKRELLPHLLGYLAERGLGGDRVHLLVCRGTHREMTGAELDDHLGPEVVAAHKVFQHDPDGPLRELGVTARGTPVAFAARLWDYKLLLPVTGVVHHYFAGFGGGRKIFLPGCAGRRTIQASHELVFRSPAEGGGRRPGVESGRLPGNAVSEEFAEAARLIDLPIFLVATIRGGAVGAFAGFWAGDLMRAHAAACKAYLGWRAYPVRRPYDLVLAACGGHPLDTNLVQAHKGMDNAMRLLRPGGRAILLAACGDGLGGEDMEEFVPLAPAEIERRLRQRYRIYGQTVYAIKEKAARAAVTLVSELPAETVRALGMTPARSLAEALSAVLPQLPPGHTTALFPDAGALLPLTEAELKIPRV